MIHIGIDTGVNTGIACWCDDKKKFTTISSVMIHEAFNMVLHELTHNDDVIVYVEDARQRKWFGNNSEAKKQGAGSVKRDAKIWEDFLKDMNINYQMIHPLKGFTKLDKDQFKKLTGWTKRTNEHSRDASMIVFKK